MATLTHRSTDCLGGRIHRDAFRRYLSRGVCAAATSANKQTRPAVHGRHRGRKPRHAAASTVQPPKLAMENVVILKPGEPVVPKSETATAPDQCGEPSVKSETMVADDRCPPPTEKASSTKIDTETVTSADRCSVQASMTKAVAGTDLRTAPVKKPEDVAAADRRAEPVKKVEAVAAANRVRPKARKAEAAPIVYAGASFVVSPDPCELPITVALFKPRGERTAVCA